MAKLIKALLLGASLAASVAQAQPPVTDQAAPDPQTAPATGTIPALTPVRIELLATLNSAISKIGEHFPIRLAEPIILPDGTTIPAGIMGQGDVVHAAKSRFGGKAGEMILAVRYLDWDGTKIPLRSLRLTQSKGKDRGDTAFAVSMAGAAGGIAAMFITGGEVNVPEGTFASAMTSAAVALPSTAKAPTAAAPTTQEQPAEK